MIWPDAHTPTPLGHLRSYRKTRRVRGLPCGNTRIYLVLEIRRIHCEHCGTVTHEPLDPVGHGIA